MALHIAGTTNHVHFAQQIQRSAVALFALAHFRKLIKHQTALPGSLATRVIHGARHGNRLDLRHRGEMPIGYTCVIASVIELMSTQRRNHQPPIRREKITQ